MKTNNANTKLKSLREIKREVYNLHKVKYKTDVDTYNLKVVNEIIYNEKSRIVAIFKDFLILDDISEFLRRFYNKSESSVRLNKVISFYEAYSRIFPNYIIIPESKYLYKNIRRKQKMIDAYNQIKAEEEENRKCVNDVIINNNKNQNKDNFFDSEIRRSILRYQPSYNLENSLINNKTQSIIIWQDAVNDSTQTSNLNKNIIENEESILSIQNIISAMDKKTIGPLSNRLLISNKLKSSRNSLEKSKKAVGVLDDSKKKLKSILSESNLKPKNMVNNIGLIISSSNFEGYGQLQAQNNTNSNNLQNNLYFQSTPFIQNNATNLQNGSNSLRKKFDKFEKTDNKNNNLKTQNKDILNNFTTGNPIFPLSSNINKNLEKPSLKKNPYNTNNNSNKIDIIDELVLQNSNQELGRTQHISPGPEISERKLDPPSAIFKNRLATHRVSSSIPELYNTVKIINHYPSIIIPQGSTHVSINQNYYNYGNSFASPVGTRIITIENYNGSSTNTSKSKLNKKKTYSESFEPQNSGLKRTKTISKEISSNSNTNLKGNPVTSNITSPKNLKIKSKESKEILVNSGSTINSQPTNNSSVKKNKFNEGVIKNNFTSTGSSHNTQYQQNNLKNQLAQQNGQDLIPVQNLESSAVNISSPKTGGKQVYSKVFKVFQENFKNINSYNSKNQKTIENQVNKNNKNLVTSGVGSQVIKKENLENLIMQDDFGSLESDRQFKSRLEIREAVIKSYFIFFI
jgi:hypothetical protein